MSSWQGRRVPKSEARLVPVRQRVREWRLLRRGPQVLLQRLWLQLPRASEGKFHSSGTRKPSCLHAETSWVVNGFCWKEKLVSHGTNSSEWMFYSIFGFACVLFDKYIFAHEFSSNSRKCDLKLVLATFFLYYPTCWRISAIASFAFNIYIVGNRGLPWFMFFAFLVKKTSGILFFGPNNKKIIRKFS